MLTYDSCSPLSALRRYPILFFSLIKAYSRVLQGHIGLATATFPDGTPGFMIDAFARRFLWDAGLDYQHGTGHGVGAALNVHEGPHVRPHSELIVLRLNHIGTPPFLYAAVAKRTYRGYNYRL